jgi:hypothetical protein
VATIFLIVINSETVRINSINIHEVPVHSVNFLEGPINNYNSERVEPTYDKINEIIKKLKPSKAAGPEEILPEFIKNGGRTINRNYIN